MPVVFSSESRYFVRSFLSLSFIISALSTMRPVRAGTSSANDGEKQSARNNIAEMNKRADEFLLIIRFLFSTILRPPVWRARREARPDSYRVRENSAQEDRRISERR